MVLTPFHEAGDYAIFRCFGRFVMTLGGTLGQHLFPIVAAGALLIKRRDAFGAALFFWLPGYSVPDMGVCMFDAFDPKMMLLDGRTGADRRPAGRLQIRHSVANITPCTGEKRGLTFFRPSGNGAAIFTETQFYGKLGI